MDPTFGDFTTFGEFTPEVLRHSIVVIQKERDASTDAQYREELKIQILTLEKKLIFNLRLGFVLVMNEVVEDYREKHNLDSDDDF